MSPKVNVISPTLNVVSPKVNVKYFGGIFEEFKVFEISCWGVTVTGVSKISNLSLLVLFVLLLGRGNPSSLWARPFQTRCQTDPRSNARRKREAPLQLIIRHAQAWTSLRSARFHVVASVPWWQTCPLLGCPSLLSRGLLLWGREWA